jgi:hypothetical protein
MARTLWTDLRATGHRADDARTAIDEVAGMASSLHSSVVKFRY